MKQLRYRCPKPPSTLRNRGASKTRSMRHRYSQLDVIEIPFRLPVVDVAAGGRSVYRVRHTLITISLSQYCLPRPKRLGLLIPLMGRDTRFRRLLPLRNLPLVIAHSLSTIFLFVRPLDHFFLSRRTSLYCPTRHCNHLSVASPFDSPGATATTPLSLQLSKRQWLTSKPGSAECAACCC